MKTVVLYDSVYGNTKTIAEAVASGLPKGTVLATPKSADGAGLAEAELIVLGSPTQAGRPTPGMQAVLDRLQFAPGKAPEIAVFDTRVAMKFAKLFGYAAPRMATQLEKKGCRVRGEAQGFIVKGREGPLLEGEEQRARAWGVALQAGRTG